MSAPWASGWIRYGRRDRVVDDQWNPVLMGHRGDVRDVQNVDLRVGDRLGEERLGVRPYGRPPRIQVVGVLDEADLDADLGQRVVEEVVGAAVQPGAGHDVIAGIGQVQDREVLRGLTGRQEQRGDAAFECGDALLHDVLRRVHDPGVDVARLGEAEQRGRMLGAVERVRRGLVDRQRPRVGGDIGCLASVDLLGLERPTRRRVFWRAHRKRTSISSGGPSRTDPRLPVTASCGYSTWSITRGTPPRLEGCRPASRGLTLALMTEKSVSHDAGWVPAACFDRIGRL